MLAEKVLLLFLLHGDIQHGDIQHFSCFMSVTIKVASESKTIY